MKNLINNIKVKMIAKSLASNGIVRNIFLKVGGNSLHIGEVSFSDNEGAGKFNANFDKEVGGGMEFSGNYDCKLIVKDLSIKGDGGEEFSMELLELNSIAEAMELFASIVK